MLGLGSLAKKLFGSANDRYLAKLEPRIAAINALESEMEALARRVTALLKGLLSASFIFLAALAVHERLPLFIPFLVLRGIEGGRVVGPSATAI